MFQRLATTGVLLAGGLLAAGFIAGGLDAANTSAQAIPVVGVTSVAKPIPVVEPDGPAIEPGKVRWHSSVEAALAVARRSGKPVLVFHMMGRLDKQFC